MFKSKRRRSKGKDSTKDIFNLRFCTFEGVVRALGGCGALETSKETYGDATVHCANEGLCRYGVFDSKTQREHGKMTKKRNLEFQKR